MSKQRIFGIGSASMYNISLTLRQRYSRKQLRILSGNIVQLQNKTYARKVKKAKLVLAGNIKDFAANIKLLNKSRAAVVVFDHPSLLECYGVPQLDRQDNKLLGKFTQQPIDYATLFEAVDNPAKKRHSLVRKTTNLMERIIQMHSTAGFLDKFNTLIYQITTPNNRGVIRNSLIRYVFGLIDYNELMKQLNQNTVKITAKNRPGFTAVIEYLESDKGVVLRRALKEAQKLEEKSSMVNNKRTVPYTKVAERHGVDRFDLHNLILMLRTVQ